MTKQSTQSSTKNKINSNDSNNTNNTKANNTNNKAKTKNIEKNKNARTNTDTKHKTKHKDNNTDAPSKTLPQSSTGTYSVNSEDDIEFNHNDENTRENVSYAMHSNEKGRVRVNPNPNDDDILCTIACSKRSCWRYIIVALLLLGSSIGAGIYFGVYRTNEGEGQLVLQSNVAFTFDGRASYCVLSDDAGIFDEPPFTSLGLGWTVLGCIDETIRLNYTYAEYWSQDGRCRGLHECPFEFVCFEGGRCISYDLGVRTFTVNEEGAAVTSGDGDGDGDDSESPSISPSIRGSSTPTTSSSPSMSGSPTSSPSISGSPTSSPSISGSPTSSSPSTSGSPTSRPSISGSPTSSPSIRGSSSPTIT